MHSQVWGDPWGRIETKREREFLFFWFEITKLQSFSHRGTEKFWIPNLFFRFFGVSFTLVLELLNAPRHPVSSSNPNRATEMDLKHKKSMVKSSQKEDARGMPDRWAGTSGALLFLTVFSIDSSCFKNLFSYSVWGTLEKKHLETLWAQKSWTNRV